MPIGITEEHEALRERGPPVRRHAHPARGAACRARRRARDAARVLGRAWRAGLARAARRRGVRRRGLRLRRAGGRARGARPRGARPVRTSRPVARGRGARRTPAAPRPTSWLPQLVRGEATGAVALERRRPGPRRHARRRDRRRDRRRPGTRSRREHADGRPSCTSVDPTRRAAPRRARRRAAAGRPAARDHDASACASSPRCCSPPKPIGIAQWCVDTAAEYAKVRVQFGRPIGQFQGVKHRCADMLARTELARAAVWDAAARRATSRQRRARRDRGRGRARVRRRVPRTARTACRRSAASASRGSTTRTSTCAGR